MKNAPRLATRLIRLGCLLVLLASAAAVTSPSPASACMTFGTYVYYNCQGQYLATCRVQTNCVSCCSGSIAGWCSRTFTPGSPICIPD